MHFKGFFFFFYQQYEWTESEISSTDPLIIFLVKSTQYNSYERA